MNDERPVSVPFFAHEAEICRLEERLHLWQALAGFAAAVAVLLLHKAKQK